MRLSKFDIGAEVISILTKGMYPDPRDAVREYIQNAVDAKAKNVSVNVRQSSVVVEDDGSGMDYDTLRKAVRIGISDKRPGKDVGFMGIGIYSAFHLCDTLTIYTRKADLMPQMLRMNFANMRATLREQRNKRLNNEIDSDELIDLQTLLGNNIVLPDEGTLNIDEYPVVQGTRVEIFGLNPILDDYLNDFDKLSSYLRDVVPLHFDKDNFEWAELIEGKIQETCNDNNAHFELVNLNLGISGRSENLYRPYKNSIFHNSISQKPLFREIKKDKIFLGIAWGCLNSDRARISNEELRGFLLKKQGFSIGKRETLARFYGHSNTYFERYVGEIIVVHPDILPNAARNGLEFSPLRTWFDERMAKDVAKYFNDEAGKFQEQNKAEELLEKIGNQLKAILARFSPNEDNPNTLINLIAEINNNVKSKITASRNGKMTRTAKKEDFRKIYLIADQLEKDIKKRLENLYEVNKVKQPKHGRTQSSVAKKLTQYTALETLEKFESIVEVLDKLGIDYSEFMKDIWLIVDEKFVQSIAKNKTHYYRLLSEFKDEIENLDL